MTKIPKKNLKRLVKLIIFFQMKREKQTTISLVTLLLKVEVEAVKVLVVSIHLLFQIYLKTFSVILEEDLLEKQVIEEAI